MKNNDSRLTKATNFYNAARITSNFALLEQAGFNESALEEGGTLIGRAVRLVRLCAFPTDVDSRLLASIDAYQSRWFPTVRAVLERHYLELGKLFFANMVQLDEKRSPISLLEFLETLDRLGKGAAPFEEKGPEARALISERMLTAEVEAEGQALLAEWNQLAKQGSTTIVNKGEVEAAIDAAWKWRSEWAEHARTVIKSRGLLRGLGIRQTKHRSSRAETETTTPTLPAVAETVTPPALTTGAGVATVVEVMKAS